MSFSNLKTLVSPAIQAIVQKYQKLLECKNTVDCRCDRCKSTLAAYPSRKKAREGSSFTKFAFPLVRSVFPPARAPSLVSIQPMSQPHSGVFYINYSKDDSGDSDEDLEKDGK